jgi:hypothetical protein
MNLFQAEEHARRWAQFDPAWEANLKPVSAWIERFAAEMFRARIRPRYISWWTAWRASQPR